MALRILATIIILLSVLFMPFWFSVILVLLGIIYFSFFFEALILIFISDLLHGANEGRYFHSIFLSLVIFSLLFILIEFLKKKFIFDPAK